MINGCRGIGLLLNPFPGLSYYALLLEVSFATVGCLVVYGFITKWKLLYETRSIVRNVLASKQESASG
jgi:hypothetical protein